MRNPCPSCDLYIITNKNNYPRCRKCKKRAEYLGSIGPAGAAVPFEKTRVCTGAECHSKGTHLPISDFNKHPTSKDGLAKLCKRCYSKALAGGRKKPKQSAPNPPPKPLSKPLSEPTGNNVLSIDFSANKEIFSQLKKIAREDERTVEAQARFILKTYVSTV